MSGSQTLPKRRNFGVLGRRSGRRLPEPGNAGAQIVLVSGSLQPSEYPGTGKRVAGKAGDLIVHRVFAGRDRDWADVAGIIRQRDSLDRDLILSELASFRRARSVLFLRAFLSVHV